MPTALSEEVDLNALLAETEIRVLREDFTFRYRNEHWQVDAMDAQHLRPKQKITVERRLDGSVHYRCGGRYLTPDRCVTPAEPRKPPPPPPRRRLTADHPWRKSPIVVGRALHGGRQT